MISWKPQIYHFAEIIYNAQKFLFVLVILILILPFGVMSIHDSSYWELSFAQEANNQTSSKNTNSAEVTSSLTILPKTDKESKKLDQNKVVDENLSSTQNNQVRSYYDIPEEYIIQGIEFELYWIDNGVKINVLNDPRFEVEFIDTNENGLIDRAEWLVPELSEQEFILEADITNSKTIDVTSKLKTMKEKIDRDLYEKSLDILNAQAMNRLQKYTTVNTASITTSSEEGYHTIIIFVNKTNEKGAISQDTANSNKIYLEDELLHKLNAIDVYKAETLSFITAKIPISELHNLVEYDSVFKMGDAEGEIVAYLDVSKPSIGINNVPAGIDGTGVTVTIMDSGIRQDHPDLPVGTKITKQTQCGSFSCNDSGTFDDTINHGTHSAGIVGGLGTIAPNLAGVAPGTSLLNARVDFVGGIALAFDWSITNNADIITSSIGPGTACSAGVGETLSLIGNEVVDLGIVYVQSAGNDGSGLSTIVDPACGHNVITVGNLDDMGTTGIGDDQIRISSSRGPTQGIFENGRLKPEIVAPGTNIDSPDQFQFFSEVTGTSFAAPTVAGSAALLLDAHPEFSPIEVKAALLTGAVWQNPISTTASEYENFGSIDITLNTFGMGYLDIGEAISLADQGKIIGGTISDGQSKDFEFTANANEQVKVIMTWLEHPTGTISSPIEIQISNLDFTIKRFDTGAVVATSDSTNQNVEFAVFDAPVTGTYTLTITAPFVHPTFVVNEDYALGSTHQITLPSNIAPNAEAQPGFQDVDSGTLVTIDGSNSIDPDDGPQQLQFFWEQLPTGAPTVVLSDPNAAVVTFTAPILPHPSFVNILLQLNVDDGILSDTANAVIRVNSVPVVNLPPVANDDLVSTPEDTAVIIDIMGNDFDPEGQPIQFASVDSTSAQGGTIINNGNDVTYAPPSGFSGTDTFTYTITDGVNTSNTATVTVSVGSEIGIYVSCDGTGCDKVLRFKLDGTFVDEFVTQGSGGLTAAWHIVFGPNGDLYVTNDAAGSAGKVLRYDGTTGDPKPASGKTGAIFVDTNLVNARGIAFDSNDVMYVTSGSLTTGAIKKFDGNTGALLGAFPDSISTQSPDVFSILQLQSLAFGGPTNLLHSLTNQGDRVSRWDVSTGTLADNFFITLDSTANALQMAFGPFGDIYITDKGPNPDVLLRYDGTSGAQKPAQGPDAIYAAGSFFDDPTGILFDSNNNILISNEDDDNVIIIEGPNGANPGSLLSGGIAAGSGGLNEPHGLVFGSIQITSAVPDAITNLNAVAISSGQIELSWPPAPADNNSPIVGYKIESESPTGGGFTVRVVNTGMTSTTFSDFGLTALTQYNYRVSAINGIGTANPSNEAEATTLSTSPIAVDDNANTIVDTLITIDVLGNDIDVEGDPLSVNSVVSPSAQGGTIVNNVNDVTYTPPLGFTGTDTFTYTASDGTSSSNSATVNLTINSPSTCGLTVDDATTTYPAIIEDGVTATADQTVGLTKQGNAANTVLSTQGTGWQVGGAGADIMPVGATAFSNTGSVPHASKTLLTGADQTLVSPFTGTISSFWSLLPDTLSGPQPGFAGVLQQTITFTVACP